MVRGVSKLFEGVNVSGLFAIKEQQILRVLLTLYVNSVFFRTESAGKYTGDFIISRTSASVFYVSIGFDLVEMERESTGRHVIRMKCWS